MRIYMAFIRDQRGRVRLLHAWDEVEARQAAMMRMEPQGLVDALVAAAPEQWAKVAIDTDDPILRDSIDTFDRIDFDQLLNVRPPS